MFLKTKVKNNLISSIKENKLVIFSLYYFLVVHIPVTSIHYTYGNVSQNCSLIFKNASINNGTLLSAQTTPGIHYCSFADHITMWPIWIALVILMAIFAVAFTMATMFGVIVIPIWSLWTVIITFGYILNILFWKSKVHYTRTANPIKYFRNNFG